MLHSARSYARHQQGLYNKIAGNVKIMGKEAYINSYITNNVGNVGERSTHAWD